MPGIIPSINVSTFIEVQERIAKIEPYVLWCHLDVTDGVFSKHKTWNEPRDLSLLKTTLKCEVHLMIENPEAVIDDWLVEPIRRVIVHLEATKDPELVIRRCRSASREVGFAINPETSWERFEPWLGMVDLFLPLGVSPGASGQQADMKKIFDKIASIRKACLECILEADGGVNMETAPQFLKAGANCLVAGSAIFNSDDISAAIREFQNL